ncbi:MAG: hypothetical protein D6797_08995 [Bdellovibrio sp.]|nr:MAG: hypothetical protein D6797_08995 [Bdellovibrio sp.]
MKVFVLIISLLGFSENLKSTPSLDVVYQKLSQCSYGLQDHRSSFKQIQVGFSHESCSLRNSSVLNHLREISGSVMIERSRLLALDNALKSFLKYRLQFSQEPLSKAKWIRAFCPDKICSVTTRAFLEKQWEKHLQGIRLAIQQGKLKKYSSKEAVNELNSRVKELQEQQQRIADLIKEQGMEATSTKEQYDLYLKKYLNNVSDTLGSLMITEPFKDKSGGLLDLKDFHRMRTRAGKVYVSYLPHRLLKRRECMSSQIWRNPVGCHFNPDQFVKTMLDDVTENLVAYARKVHEASSLTDLVRVSPVAVGQALAQMPNQVDTVCKATQELVSQDERYQKMMTAAEWALTGLDVAALTTLVTGVGVGVKAATASVKMGLRKMAQKAFQEAAQPFLETGSSLAVKSGLGRAVLAGHGYFEYSEDRDTVISSRLAESQTPDQYRRALELEKRLQESAIQAGMGVLELTSGSGFLSALRKNGELARLFGFPSSFVDKLRADEKIASVLEIMVKENPRSIRKLNRLSDQLGLTQEEMDIFKVALSSQSPSEIKAFLKFLSERHVDKKRLKKLIQDVNANLRKTCRVK